MTTGGERVKGDSFLTLSPPRVSLLQVKSSGVGQSKIYKWPLLVKGLSTSRNVLKEHQKTSQFQTIILQLLAYIRLLNVTFYDAFLDHDKINVDNIFQLKIALDCFFFCIVELFVCCHLFCACACVKYLILVQGQNHYFSGCPKLLNGVGCFPKVQPYLSRQSRPQIST